MQILASFSSKNVNCLINLNINAIHIQNIKIQTAKKLSTGFAFNASTIADIPLSPI